MIKNDYINEEAKKVRYWIEYFGITSEFSDEQKYLLDADVDEISIIPVFDCYNIDFTAITNWYYVFRCTFNGKQEAFKCKNIFLKNE